MIDPVLKVPYSRDPRFVARKAERHLKDTGVAQTSYFGPELEFFIFDSIRFDQNTHCGYYYVDSVEGACPHPDLLSWDAAPRRRFAAPRDGSRPRRGKGAFSVVEEAIALGRDGAGEVGEEAAHRLVAGVRRDGGSEGLVEVAKPDAALDRTARHRRCPRGARRAGAPRGGLSEGLGRAGGVLSAREGREHTAGKANAAG